MSERLTVTLEPDFLAFIDAKRGSLSRPAFIIKMAAVGAGYKGVAVKPHGDGLRYTRGKRCQCGEAARFPENGITCEVCGKPMF